MLDEKLRGYKEVVMRPLAVRAKAVPALAVTALGLLLGLGAALAAAVGAFGPALWLWLGNRACDGLDGTLARLQGRSGDLGGFLDLGSDFIVYAAVPAGLAASRPTVGALAALAFMLATFYVNAGTWLYISAALEKWARVEGRTSIVMPPGLIEGAETVVIYCLFLLFPAWTCVLFTAMGILVVLTIAGRVRWAVRHLGPGTGVAEARRA